MVDANKLSLNRTKSKIMLFSIKMNTQKHGKLEVGIGQDMFEQVSQFKYLGIELECHLSFVHQIKRICSKVNQRNGLLWRIRSFISTSLAKQLYQSLIEPHFLYLDYVYDGCGKTLTDQLQRVACSVKSRSTIFSIHPT